MQLTEQDQNRVKEWLQTKCGPLRCTCCGQIRWQFGISGVFLGFDLHSTRFFYHQGIPLLSVVCENCGHTLFFNSGVMGFKPDEPKVIEVGEVMPPLAPAQSSPSDPPAE